MDTRAEKLRVLWNKGRNMYAAFFCELEDVRKDIGDEKLSEWCFCELQISLSILYDIAAVLKKGDAARVKADLAYARKHEQEQRKSEAAARAVETEQRNIERAAARLEAAKLESEAKAIKTKDEKAARKSAASKKAAQTAKANKAKCSEITNLPPANADEFELCVWRCLNVENDLQWVRGDCAIIVNKEKKYGEKTLARFAERIGVEYGTLRHHLSVAKAWPEIGTRGPYTVCRELANHPNRVALVTADPGMTYEDARRLIHEYKELQQNNVVLLREA